MSTDKVALPTHKVGLPTDKVALPIARLRQSRFAVPGWGMAPLQGGRRDVFCLIGL
ncbi:MAG: hypothetical protein IID33_05855 [Planctomycetes bacterium]|nr:hypothetical protein [Planctomycetota bacterium]